VTQILLGYYKFIEEMGELNQVFGKMGAFPTGPHEKKLAKFHEWVLAGIIEEDRPITGTHHEQSAA